MICLLAHPCDLAFAVCSSCLYALVLLGWWWWGKWERQFNPKNLLSAVDSGCFGGLSLVVSGWVVILGYCFFPQGDLVSMNRLNWVSCSCGLLNNCRVAMCLPLCLRC
jgi:hypothetical protein